MKRSRDTGDDMARPNRRQFLTTAAVALAAPAIFRATPAAAAVARDAGTMLLLGFDGSSPDSRGARQLARDLANGWAGGVNFHGNNISTRANVLALAGLFAEAGPQALIATDQEGGNVQRLGTGQGFTRIPRAVTVGNRMTAEEALELYAAAGAEFVAAGFNFNLAPVVDLHDPDNGVIGRLGRAYSSDPAVVTALASALVDGFVAAGSLTSIKHFPGHGRSRGDTHNGAVDVTLTWTPEELVPFQAMIAAGKAQMIMTAHVSHDTVTGGLPASISPVAVAMLRRDLGYNGVIATDDLDMDAIRDRMSLEDAVIAAIGAGHDLLLMSNSLDLDPEIAPKAVDWIARAAVDRRLSALAIAASAARIRRLKRTIGLIG